MSEPKVLSEISKIEPLTATELGYVDGTESNIQTQLNGKQATLVSGESIKTINGQSILGAGNISTGGGVTGVKGNNESTYRDGNVNLTAANIGAVASINTDNVPDASGNVVLNKVPYADNLASVDNQEDRSDYTFRTAGGSASISTGSADLGYVMGNSIVTGLDESTRQATLISIARPQSFKSVLFNAFNQYDVTCVLTNKNLTFDGEGSGSFVTQTGYYCAIVHVAGGIIAGNGNKGYTAAWLQSENTPIADIDNVFSAAAWCATKPTASTTGLTQLNSSWITGDSYGKRLSVPMTATVDGATVDMPNGYMVIACRDIEHLYVHPRWSGYMDGSVAAYTIEGVVKTYKESTITFPTQDASSTTLPYAQHGLASLTLTTGGRIQDEINLTNRQYIQRVGYLPYSAANLAIVQALTNEYVYDTNTILYQLEIANTYTLPASVTATYEVDDFGTEEFTYLSGSTEMELTGDNWYGQNLVDKLRTDVVTISSQVLTAAQKASITNDIGALSTSQLGAANGVAQLDAEGKIPTSQIGNYAKSVNNEIPDSTGNIELTTVPFAENIVSPDNTSDSDKYVFRTSGGSASLSDGEAQITEVSGNSANPTHVNEAFTITVTDTNTGINNAITINENVWFTNAVVGAISGTYTFEYDGVNWYVTCSAASITQAPITLADCGVTLARNAYINDKFVVTYTRNNSATGAAYATRTLTPTINATTWASTGIDVSEHPALFTAKALVYYVASGVTYYSDSALTQTAGTTTERISATYVNTTYGTIVISGTTFYVASIDIMNERPWRLTQNGSQLADDVSLTTYGITITGSNILIGDILRVSLIESELTVTENFLCAYSFNPVSQLDRTVWFGASSPVKNTRGATTFTLTNSNWVCSANNTTYTDAQLSTVFGVTFTKSTVLEVFDGDTIEIDATITVQTTNVYDQYLSINTFAANFGDTTSEESNKSLWRALITNSGTYKFTLDDYVPNGTTYYYENTLTTIAGSTAANTKITSRAPKYGVITLADVQYYVAPSAITLTRYTINNGTTDTGSVSDLGTYGLQLNGTIGRQDYVQVAYTKLVPGAISTTTPTAFKSIGNNSFNWRNYVSGYTISNGTIVAGTETDYVAWCHLCYADDRGWSLYSKNGFGTFNAAWSANEPQAATITSTVLTSLATEGMQIREDLGGVDPTTAGAYVPTAPAELKNLDMGTDHAPGWIVVSMTVQPAVSNTEGNLCIHPRWSGYRNLTEGYITDAGIAAYNELTGDTLTLGTDYDSHTTTIVLPRYGVNDDTSAIEALPYVTYGLPSVGAIADKIALDRNKYIQNIGVLSYSVANLNAVKAMGVAYEYDYTYIYYVLTSPKTYSLFDYVAQGTTYYSDTALTTSAGTVAADYVSVDSTQSNYGIITISGGTYYVHISSIIGYTNIYVIGDFGTEEYLGTTLAAGSKSLYGQNLRDKLRTDVLTVSGQTLTSAQKTTVQNNLDVYSTTETNTLVNQKAHSSIITDAYSATDTYAIGDLCIYANNVYVCIQGCTGISPLNTAYWTHTTIDQLLSLKTNLSYSGSGALSTTAQTLAGGINELQTNKLNTSSFNSSIANYYTKTEANTLLNTKAVYGNPADQCYIYTFRPNGHSYTTIRFDDMTMAGYQRFPAFVFGISGGPFVCGLINVQINNSEYNGHDFFQLYASYGYTYEVKRYGSNDGHPYVIINFSGWDRFCFISMSHLTIWGINTLPD